MIIISQLNIIAINLMKTKAILLLMWSGKVDVSF